MCIYIYTYIHVYIYTHITWLPLQSIPEVKALVEGANFDTGVVRSSHHSTASSVGCDLPSNHGLGPGPQIGFWALEPGCLFRVIKVTSTTTLSGARHEHSYYSYLTYDRMEWGYK